MAPLNDQVPRTDEFKGDRTEKKTNQFSFRWFLKRSKSSKSAKEMATVQQVPNWTVSKSCDSGIAGMDKCSTYLLWKLLPSRGKTLIGVDRSKPNSQSRAFKMSFSCGDVPGMFPQQTKNGFASARSSHNIQTVMENSNVLLKPPSRSSHCNLSNRISSLHSLGPSDKQDQLCEFTPDVCHLVLCKLCLSMILSRNMYTLEDCGCSYCFTCMQQYLFINIKEGNVGIMCPDAECPSKGKLLVQEIQDIVGDDVFYMFQKFKLNNDVELDPCMTWCPTPGCETICPVQPSSSADPNVAVHCLNCKSTFCSSCKLKWHRGKTCKEMKRILQDEEDFNTSDEEDAVIKRCPSCRVPIERDEGCAQMMCKRCKHVFCWHCLESLDDDFLLRHYDKGPCRNKLGHSRASMVWHRTQVVGIFAGFSFLLLVASPVLLLAAPCLLCCRCKNCKLLNEEATLL